MSLYLSRLCLNPLFAPALKLAADAYALHRKLLDTLPCRKEKPHTGEQRKTADLLFRVDVTDTGPIVLLQTSVVPKWDALELAPRALRCPPETKSYTPGFTQGQRLAFRLLCQPVIRKSGQFGFKPNGKRMPGPRRACRNDEQRLDWLRRKANDCGFAIESVGLRLVHWGNTKPLQAKGGNPIETHEEARKRAFSPDANQCFGAVQFEGVLIVIHPDKFPQAVRNGIGTQKAYGFGLLSIAPAR
jgi:CRISPR system Cascade subunit CasE